MVHGALLFVEGAVPISAGPAVIQSEVAFVPDMLETI